MFSPARRPTWNRVNFLFYERAARALRDCGYSVLANDGHLALTPELIAWAESAAGGLWASSLEHGITTGVPKISCGTSPQARSRSQSHCRGRVGPLGWAGPGGSIDAGRRRRQRPPLCNGKTRQDPGDGYTWFAPPPSLIPEPVACLHRSVVWSSREGPASSSTWASRRCRRSCCGASG